MKCNVVITKNACGDIDKITDDIYSVCMDKNIVKEYEKLIITKIQNRADFPESGSPLYLGKTFTGYRYIVCKAYMVFYKVEGNKMIVVRVLLGKSDYCKQLLLESN